MTEILEAFFRTGTGAVLAMAFSAFAVKMIAVLLGPAGVGTFSLLRQTQQIAIIVGTFGGQTALVQGLACRSGEHLAAYKRSVTWLLAAGLVLTTVCLAIAPSWMQVAVFGSELVRDANLFRWLVLPCSLGVVYTYFAGILNGHRAVTLLAISQVSAAAGLAVLSYPICSFLPMQTPMAMTIILSGGSLAGAAVAAVFCHRRGWLPSWEGLTRGPRAEHALSFIRFAGTNLVTGLMQTGTLLIVRGMIVRAVGLSSLGLFDMAWTISMTYVMLILNSFAAYYLPTLSGLSDAESRIRLVTRILQISIFVMTPLVTLVILLKPLLAVVLYTRNFTPALKIMRWMLIGDYFKVCAWVVAMPMLAYADLKAFFWSECLWNAAFLAASFAVFKVSADIEFIGAAYLLLYAVYLLWAWRHVAVRHGIRLESRTIGLWAGGLCALIAAAVLTWNSVSLHWALAAAFELVICTTLWISLPDDYRRDIVARVSR